MIARVHRFLIALAAGLLLAAAALQPSDNAESVSDAEAIPAWFLLVVTGEPGEVDEALQEIEQNWKPSFVPMVLESIRLIRRPETVLALLNILQSKTGHRFGYELDEWYEWWWNEAEQRHPHYARYKSNLYRLIDRRFGEYFNDDRTSRVRLDEVVWGGVAQDGIPPLRGPKMISAVEADYLEDGNVIFGISVNGDTRAYPKRILAWHEMFVDDVGGVPVAGVYCTLCGAMILYKTEFGGVNHALGTSGFLYRSNKLMYDRATQSLWNTMWGSPVIGPLADKDIRLERLSVVTTTWGEWRQRHPDTLVLSLDTGHQRDYSEGEAYREYFATDRLMFTVPFKDGRLNNKAEVLGLLFAEHPDKPLAISADYLSKHPVHHDRVEDVEFVVLTDRSGANRVYQSEGVTFVSWNQSSEVVDAKGETWNLSEESLMTTDGRTLLRLPAHRAFWFGWYSAYSHTRLVS